MYGYVCFYNGQRAEIYAETLYQAKLKAMEHFQKTAGRRKVKGELVSVVLAERPDGSTVVQRADT